ncbi:DUF6262 family protein [Brevibacillus brevis]|uniref:DUF6262 family protein n=1 Tax=Brevibacillus brevis TaxID=1393 RepID=UPI0037C86B54
MANNNPNTEAIINHAKAKTEATKKKVDNALKLMIKKQMKINFNSVSEESGVSKGYLYKNSELRHRIETLRLQQEGLPSPRFVKRNTSESSKDVLIAILRKKVEDLTKENKKLKQQLKIHFGTIYEKI